MLNFIWIAIMVVSVIFGVMTGHITDVVNSVTENAKFAFELALGLAGVMMLWLGLMKIAEDAGIISLLGRLLKPIMRWLFPEVPPEHPAMGVMVSNLAANMLGLANAATPMGLRAMQHLDSLNPNPGVATHAMCTFLALNTSSVQLIPATAIAYLAANGAIHPTDVIASALLATLCSTIAAIIAVKLFAQWSVFKLKIVGESV